MTDLSNNHTLIPFGLHKDSKIIDDIYDVPKGKACGCVCPSCNTLLIAKQGNVNEWHFAHLSNKDAVNNVNDICQYSFYTSVRLMALQLISQNLKIDLPSYDAVVTQQHREIYIKEEFTVTVWCSGVIETTLLFIAPHKSWYDWFNKIPIGFVLFMFYNATIFSYSFIPKDTFSKTIVFGWIISLVTVSFLYFFKEKLFPIGTIRVNEKEGFIQRNSAELALVLALISIVVTIVGWFVK